MSGGRHSEYSKSKYEKVKLRFDEIKVWIEEGLPIKDIAKNLKMSPYTLYKYRNLHKEFDDLFKDIQNKYNNNGRISDYEKRIKYMLDEIIAWREQGLSIEDIALKLGIHKATMYEYKKCYSDFNDALSHSKVKLVNKLKKSLWKEAMGYDYDEVQLEESYLGTKRKITKKYARSQATLLIYALQFLDPEFKKMAKDMVDNDINIKADFPSERIKQAFDILYPGVDVDINDDKDAD